MNILVLNAGSSSVKYKLFDSGFPRRAGVVERVSDYAAAFDAIAADLGDAADQLEAIGHRIVHGGQQFVGATLLNPSVVDQLDGLSHLAPLHNPPGVSGIHAATARWPDLPQVAVFDTAFHATLPETAWRYALPRRLSDRLGIRRYGFHGTSYQSVTRQAAKLMGKPVDRVNLIAAHLGNGASMAAIKNGRSVDTTMGMTPLEGLVMGTRSGDIDPAIALLLQDHLGDVEAVRRLLNTESGMLGLCDTADLREVVAGAESGNANAANALDIYCRRIRKTIGAYLAVLEGNVDAMVFTAGVGENQPEVRARATRGLSLLGIEIDPEANAGTIAGPLAEIQTRASRIRVLVIATDEELEIAMQTGECLSPS